MPKLELVEAAPAPSKVSQEVLQERRMYEEYIVKVAEKGKIGKLDLDDDEPIAGVRMRLSHASRRLGRPIDMWAVENTIYFRPHDDSKN